MTETSQVDHVPTPRILRGQRLDYRPAHGVEVVGGGQDGGVVGVVRRPEEHCGRRTWARAGESRRTGVGSSCGPPGPPAPARGGASAARYRRFRQGWPRPPRPGSGRGRWLRKPPTTPSGRSGARTGSPTASDRPARPTYRQRSSRKPGGPPQGASRSPCSSENLPAGHDGNRAFRLAGDGVFRQADWPSDMDGKVTVRAYHHARKRPVADHAPEPEATRTRPQQWRAGATPSPILRPADWDSASERSSRGAHCMPQRAAAPGPRRT